MKMVRTILLFSFLCCLATLQVSAQAEPIDGPNDVIGIWLSENGNEKIEIYKKGDSYNGTMIWMKDENDENGNRKLDDKNPDASLRNRPMVGVDILFGFKYSGNGWFNQGRIYDPGTGKTYRARIHVSDKNTAKIRGYIGIPLIGRSELCTKIQ